MQTVKEKNKSDGKKLKRKLMCSRNNTPRVIHPVSCGQVRKMAKVDAT